MSEIEVGEYKTDSGLLDLTNEEIVEEAIASLIDSMGRKSDGFRRIEKVALVAIHILIEQLEKEKQKLIEKLEEDRMKEFDDYTISLIESYLEIAKGEKNE